MRRREFLPLLGAMMVARPLSAEQKAMPVIGYLNATSPEANADSLAAFRQGLGETGYVEGQRVAIEYRWAEEQYDRLAALADELVRRNVRVITSTGGRPVAQAAKTATKTIPIVFVVGSDPVRDGLVASLARPGGNVTGVTFLTGALTSKRLQLLNDLVPNAAAIGLLLNPAAGSEATSRDAQEAARATGKRLIVVGASTDDDIETAFASLGEQRVDALLIGGDPFLNTRRARLIALAAHYAIPAMHEAGASVKAGGLISYGASVATAYRLAGSYTGRILQGAKPADLPVQQPTIFELVVNLKTAKELGLTVPPSILARATEVIE